MKNVVLMIVIFLNSSKVYSQVNNFDSITVSNFKEFSEILSEYIDKKYSNSKIYFSEDRIYSIQILRVNDWTELRLTNEIKLDDPILKVIINKGCDTLNWETGFYYSKFISHFVIEHATKDEINKRANPHIYISCSSEEWTRFYFSLNTIKKRSKLFFTLDVVDSKKRHQTIRCYIKYKAKNGFGRVVVLSKR